MLRGHLYNKGSYEQLDSVTISLTLNDTIPVDFKLLRGDNARRLITGNELRAMVAGGLGEYTAVFEKDGYEPLVKRFKIASVSEDVKMLGGIFMERERHRDLGEVTVTATRIKMVMKGDTIVFDAAAFDLGEGSMLNTLVEQLPGASLDEDGVIKVNGRTINELLVNGKDFFKGDPKIALENLPAYTVKNVKVYDKAAEDAYLTHSNARLTRREEEENLVMDVVLKKEYSRGYMANVEGGYGTDHRYLGRAFGLVYTDNLRISIFGNANNIGNRQQGSTSGQWNGSSSTENGELHTLRAGLDYSFDNNKRVKINGNATYAGNKDTNDDISSSTNFYPSGDIFARAKSHRRNRTHSVQSRHDFRYSGDNIFFTVDPSINWSKGRSYGDSRNATFTRDPFDAYRGAVIDSIFDARLAGSFTRFMLTRLQTLTASASDNIGGGLGINGTFRPRSWKGKLSFRANGSLNRSENDTRTYNDQAYGNASTATTPPLTQDRYNASSSTSRGLSTSLNYSRDIRRFGNSRTTNFSYNLGISYSHSGSNNNNDYFTADSLPDPLTPPSAIFAPWLALNTQTSRHISRFNNNLGSSLNLSYNSEPTAPGDSTLNPAFGVSLNVRYNHNAERYALLPLYLDAPLRAARATNFVTPTLRFSFSSNNNIRNINTSLGYNISTSAPSINYLIDYTDTSNPLNIYNYTAAHLLNETTHELSATFLRFSRTNQSHINVFGTWRVYINSVANARRYDSSTGVTVNTPENISGNWAGNIHASYARSFGSRRQWEVMTSAWYTAQNSADYSSDNAQEPTRSSVFSQTFRPSVGLVYRFTSGSSLSLGFQTAIASQRSDRENFNDMTWHEYWPSFRAFIKLPWDMELTSQFNPYLRRGYADASMNTSEYVWNATLAKSFIKPAITLKINAHDILGSAKHVYTSVNAQGRNETWRSTMPRFVMLTLSYRLDMKPGKGTDNAPRGRRGARPDHPDGQGGPGPRRLGGARRR